MPAWLIQILVGIALRFGIPYLLKKFPWLPQNLKEIIEQLIAEITEGKQKIKTAKTSAKRKLEECFGVGCSTSLK